MELITCLDLAESCDLDTVGESIYNVRIHAINIFDYDSISKELNELDEEYARYYLKGLMDKDTSIKDAKEILIKQAESERDKQMETAVKMKTLIIGPRNLRYVPEALQEQIINLGDRSEFIITDAIGGFEDPLRMFLSRIGKSKNTTLVGIDYIKENRWEMNIKILRKEDMTESEAKDPYEYRRKYMCSMCDNAIVVWDGENKNIFKSINTLKIRDKPIYIFKV